MIYRPLHRSLAAAASIAAAALSLGFSTAPLGAATVLSPYFQDFEGYTVGESTTDFAESSNAWSVAANPGGGKAMLGSISSSGNSSASVSVAGASGKDFTVSSTLQLSSIDPTGATSLNVGLAAAGSSATFGSTDYRVQLDFGGGETGQVSFRRAGSDQALTTSSGGAFTISTARVYTLTLSGVYSSPTSALITLSVTDDLNNTFTGTYQDNAALSGTNFGYRIAKNGSTSAIAVLADNFNLTVVPEPSRALLLLGGLSTLFLRRRR